MAKRYRAAAIGSTGKGGFGHGLDTAFKDLEGVDLVAVADEDPKGLEAVGKRTGARNLYADYREMLTKEKPDLVSIGPRWVDDRVEMVTAAAKLGCHIYCEKPLAGDLTDADALLDACARFGVKLAVAHQFRAFPPVRQTLKDLRAGKFGKLIRMRARPKDDERGGGEELIVHGTHLLDLMIAVAGPPRWVGGHLAVGDRDVVKADKHKASEPLGPVAGDSVAATFGFDHGVRGFFDSRALLHREGRTPYGLFLECSEASLLIRSPGDVHVYPANAVVPENPKLGWQKVWVEDWHFYPDHMPRPLNDWIHRGNQILIKDFLEAIAQDKPPPTPGTDARLALEMIQGVYTSHFAGGTRLTIPLKERRHPLGRVGEP
jgi:predicted dehydrogenase